MIGITGTDGKSTTTHLLYHILKICGIPVSMVSTVEARIGDTVADTGQHVTTPSPWNLQRFMRQAVTSGSTHFILEVTSHGLDQGRVIGTSIDIAAITNISHEHIDYHRTYAKYRDAKAKIFRGVRWSILNKDDDNFDYLEKKASGTMVTISRNGPADITADMLPLKPKIMGDFNLLNCLTAAAIARLVDIPDACITKAIAQFTGLPGRMEELPTDKPFRVIIDFAHKPNAMEHALASARNMTRGKVIVVFGCAGLRDHVKRPTMGEIAARFADYTVLTAEDPRTEDVRDIIDQISLGCDNGGAEEAKRTTRIPAKGSTKKYYWRIPDRQEAINFAIRKLAEPGDIVMLLGKGHETSMCWGKTEYPWNEKEAARKALYDTVSPAA